MKTLHDQFNIAKHLIYYRDNLTVTLDDAGFVMQEFHCEESGRVLDTIYLSPTELAFINMEVNGLPVMPEPPKPLFTFKLFGLTLAVFGGG
jgi:hypothetical protein